MTEPTEADFAAYDDALVRAKTAYINQARGAPYRVLDEFYRREVAQAIAEARAQGEAKMRAWFISHTEAFVRKTCQGALAAAEAKGRREAIEAAATIVRQHPFAEDASEGCADAQGCCEMIEAQIRALLDEKIP